MPEQAEDDDDDTSVSFRADEPRTKEQSLEVQRTNWAGARTIANFTNFIQFWEKKGGAAANFDHSLFSHNS
jgi:hypothetical protein